MPQAAAGKPFAGEPCKTRGKGSCFATGKTFWGWAPHDLLHTTSQETGRKDPNQVKKQKKQKTNLLPLAMTLHKPTIIGGHRGGLFS